MRKRMGGMYDLGRGVQNQKRMADPIFLCACEVAGVQPTRRQAGKWNNRKGAAFNVRADARRLLRLRALKNEQLQHHNNGADR